MKLALTIIGIALAASSTKFGSEAIHLENWRTGIEPSFIQTKFSEFPAPDAAPVEAVLVKIALNPVSDNVIEAELAALRLPEGPPAPPPDVPLESLCHTLASAAQAHGIPAGFFARLIWQESKFKQRVVSHAGAQGVAQFMPAVAAERGLRNPFDALDALPHSARFLKEHLDNFGNLGLAAAAYNGGARRVMDWLGRRGRLPQETRDYVKSITGHEPERWTEENQIELAVKLPSRAPCEGVADLSREAEPAKVAVQLEPPVARVIVTARIAAAKAAAAAKARLAAAKAKRGKLLAKGRGGKEKTAAAKVAQKPAASPKLPPKIADRAPVDRGKGGKTKLAETSAAKR
jgi:hypothetical protein